MPRYSPPLAWWYLKKQRQRRAAEPVPPPFDPSILFANGEQGAWYDPSDLSTVFQGTAVTIPSTFGDPVGLMQDARQELGPELFDPDLTVSITNQGGSEGAYNPETKEFSNTSIGSVNYRPNFALTVIEPQKYYRVRLKFSGNLDVIQTLTMSLYSSSPNEYVSGVGGAAIRNDGGVADFIGGRFGPGTLPRISLWTDGLNTWDGLFLDVAECSVREVLNTPLTQPTASARPTLLDVSGNLGLRFDLADDNLTTVLPQAINGDILIAGTGGTIIEPVSYAASSTFALGPDTYTDGASGVLAAVGDIVGVLLIDKTLTQLERDNLVAYYQAKGAGGLL